MRERPRVVRLSGLCACAVALLSFAQAADGPARWRPGEALRDCEACPVMVVVPAGAFTMGSPEDEPARDADEGPQHRVTIAAPFAIGKFEVTFAQWDACVAARGCSHRPQDEIRFSWIRTSAAGAQPQTAEVEARHLTGRRNMPVMRVSWRDAKAYVAWLARRTGKPYRLPTEAEWEYAARGGTSTAFWWGADADAGCDKANIADQSLREEFPDVSFATARLAGCRDGRAYLAPAGTFAANAFGLHDVTGNLSEWVEDCYALDYADAPAKAAVAPSGACRLRVARGGSWFDDPRYQRVANRNGFEPTLRPYVTGFRVARALR